jgi:Xaa-Pro aminopeptidase
MVIFSGHAPARNYPANTHVFRPASTYTYFGGPPLQHAALLIEPGSDGDAGCTLARPAFGLDDAVWEGPRPPDAAFAAAAGLSRGVITDSEQLQWLLAGHEAAGLLPPWPETIAWNARLGLTAPTPDELLAIINLRLVKDEHELAAMRRAADINIHAQRAALAAVRPGRREADVAAAFAAALVERQSQPSFTPIITIRGETFHAHGHPHALNPGALLLIDAGAEEPQFYACDITRTVPVDRKWTPVQRHLYETVLRANREACAASVPGRRWREIHDLAARVICAGLVQAELLRGDPAALAARHAHTLFFPHGLGHLIGLDVHDMEDFGDLAGYAPGRTRAREFGTKFLRLDRDLEPGYCVTVEPGIYLVPSIWEYEDLVRPFADVVDRPKVDALLRDQFGGIRIEHTIAVRAAGGPEILTEALPTDPDDVLKLLP